MLRVTILSMLLIAISINGCSKSQPVIPVPQKCVPPYTQEAKINNTPCPKGDGSESAKSARMKCVHDKMLGNYEEQKRHGEQAVNNSEVCR